VNCVRAACTVGQQCLGELLHLLLKPDETTNRLPSSMLPISSNAIDIVVIVDWFDLKDFQYSFVFLSSSFETNNRFVFIL
jgi:hypothetical protein